MNETTARRLHAVDPDAAPAVDRPVDPAPPGMIWEIHPVTGERTLNYAPTPVEQAATEQPTLGESAEQAHDVWPKRLVAGGGSAAAVVAAVGYAGPGLSAVGHAVEMGGLGVGVAAASLGGLALMVKGALGKGGQQNVSVNVTVENTLSAMAAGKVKGRRR